MTDRALAQPQQSVPDGWPTTGGRPLRVLHVLAVSIPYLNGYTMRSKYIVETQRDEGVDVVVITSPFYPGVGASFRSEAIGGVRYHRVPHPIDMRRCRRVDDLACRWLHWLRVTFPRGRITGLALLPFRVVWRGWRGAVRAARSRMRRVRAALAAHALGRLVLVPFRTIRRLAQMGSGAVARGAGVGGPPPLPLMGRLWAAAKAKLGRLSLIRTNNGLWRGAAQGLEDYLLLRRYERHLERVVRALRPDIIHAHSPYRCGVPATRVARRNRIPCVYEVRGLWEESSVAAGRFRTGDAKYSAWRRKETVAIKSADAVVCICEQLRQEVIQRGVPAERISIVPNGADTTVFCPARVSLDGADPAVVAAVTGVKARLRFPTLGYVGSIRALEGVDELVRGVGKMADRGRDCSLLIVGDGPDLDALKELARELGIADRCVFTGRVPHAQVPHYYDLIDIFVISRPSLKVTDTVTPLKPLEAMALGRALVVSDIPALGELVSHGDTGLAYRPGDPDDLADKAIQLADDDELRGRLQRAAVEWISSNRTWSAVLRGLRPTYARLLARHRSADAREGR